MSDHDLALAGMIGAVLPLLISIVVQSNWTDQTKALVAFLFCLAAAAVSSFLSDSVRLDEPGFDWVVWFGAQYGAAMILFSRFYHKVGITQTITEQTDLKPPPPGP